MMEDRYPISISDLHWRVLRSGWNILKEISNMRFGSDVISCSTSPITFMNWGQHSGVANQIEVNKLYKRARSIPKKFQTREQAELVPDDDFDAGDLTEEEDDFAVKDAVEKGDDFAFEDWDEGENEDIEEEVGWYGTGRNAV